MKTLRRLVAVGLLIGSYHVGMAQSISVPEFKSDSEKQAWIQANPEKYEAAHPAKMVERQDANVRSQERFSSEEEKKAWVEANQGTSQKFASDAEKEAWIQANPEKYEALKGTDATNIKVSPKPIVAQERVRTVQPEDRVVLPANTVKATNQISGAQTIEQSSAARTSNVSKALPKDYKPLEPNQTKEDQ